jgi:hypothetical protein
MRIGHLPLHPGCRVTGPAVIGVGPDRIIDIDLICNQVVACQLQKRLSKAAVVPLARRAQGDAHDFIPKTNGLGDSGQRDANFFAGAVARPEASGPPHITGGHYAAAEPPRQLR